MTQIRGTKRMLGRNTALGIVLPMVVVGLLGTDGCASTPSPTSAAAGVAPSTTGGAPGVGGSNGNPAANGGACSNVSPCGGQIGGTWSVRSSCLTVSGRLDLSLVGTGPSCQSTPITGSLQVTGTFSANGDGTYTDDTTTTGTEQFPLGPSCLSISSTPVTCPGAANLLTVLGYTSLTCTDATGGGCNCVGTVHQPGSMGLISISPATNGTYTSSNNTLSLAAFPDDDHYPYCVTGSELTLSVQSTSPTTSGTITLQHVDGSTGAGGTGGTGGGSAGGSAGAISGQGGSGGNGRGGAAGSAGVVGMAGSAGSGTTSQPCDIYLAGGNPCVAAHSTVRALFATYSGKLYQVRNAAGATKDITTLMPGGIADGLSQDAFCTGTTCVITVVYDQSGKGNDLWYQGSTQVPASPKSSAAKATSEALMVGGHKVYSLYINPGNSYWVDGSKSGVPTGADPEGMYMVTSGKHFNSGCCFDYGNSEVDRNADGSGAMDALNLSSTTAWGSGAGSGPWVMADLEYGLFAQGSTAKNQSDPSQTSAYVTAILKNNGKTEFALRGADATSGSLATYYKGALPGGWSPMKKQGAIVLGSGGDCCKPSGGANLSDGTFYEGCLVTGYPSDATESAIQANIVAAGYGR